MPFVDPGPGGGTKIGIDGASGKGLVRGGPAGVGAPVAGSGVKARAGAATEGMDNDLPMLPPVDVVAPRKSSAWDAIKDFWERAKSTPAGLLKGAQDVIAAWDEKLSSTALRDWMQKHFGPAAPLEGWLSWVPVFGEAWNMGTALKEGRLGKAAMHFGLALSDVALLRTAGKAAIKGGSWAMGKVAAQKAAAEGGKQLAKQSVAQTIKQTAAAAGKAAADMMATPMLGMVMITGSSAKKVVTFVKNLPTTVKNLPATAMNTLNMAVIWYKKRGYQAIVADVRKITNDCAQGSVEIFKRVKGGKIKNVGTGATHDVFRKGDIVIDITSEAAARMPGMAAALEKAGLTKAVQSGIFTKDEFIKFWEITRRKKLDPKTLLPLE